MNKGKGLSLVRVANGFLEAPDQRLAKVVFLVGVPHTFDQLLVDAPGVRVLVGIGATAQDLRYPLQVRPWVGDDLEDVHLPVPVILRYDYAYTPQASYHAPWKCLSNQLGGRGSWK